MKTLEISINDLNNWYNNLPESKSSLNEMINRIPIEYIPAYTKVYNLEISTLKRGPRKGQLRVDRCRNDAWRYRTQQLLLKEIYDIGHDEVRHLKELHTISIAYVTYTERENNPWKKLEFEKQILRFSYLYKPLFCLNDGWLKEYAAMDGIIIKYMENNEINPLTASDWDITRWTSEYDKMEREMTTRRKDLEFKDDCCEINI